MTDWGVPLPPPAGQAAVGPSPGCAGCRRAASTARRPLRRPTASATPCSADPGRDPAPAGRDGPGGGARTAGGSAGSAGDADPAGTPTQPAPPVATAPARPALWRRIVVPLCVVLGCVLAATSVAATWVKLTALDTDTYVSTVAPLTRDENVSLAISTRVVDDVFGAVDVESIVQTRAARRRPVRWRRRWSRCSSATPSSSSTTSSSRTASRARGSRPTGSRTPSSSSSSTAS